VVSARLSAGAAPAQLTALQWLSRGLRRAAEARPLVRPMHALVTGRWLGLPGTAAPADRWVRLRQTMGMGSKTGVWRRRVSPRSARVLVAGLRAAAHTRLCVQAPMIHP
jgi:hypothetical protein